MNRLILSFFVMLLLASCNREMTLDQYQAWLNSSKSDLTKERLIGEIKIGAKLEPIFEESQALQSVKLTMKLTPLKNASKGILSYVSEENDDNYQLFSRYFNEGARKDFSLQVGEDKFSPVEYYFEDYQGLTDYNIITAIYDLSDLAGSPAEDYVLVWRDDALNLGINKFRFSHEALDKAKSIKIISHE